MRLPFPRLLKARAAHLVRCDRLDQAMCTGPRQLERAYRQLVLTATPAQRDAVFQEVAGRHLSRCEGMLP